MNNYDMQEAILSEAQWYTIMGDYKKSGLTQKAFCKQRGIDFNAFKNSRNRMTYHKKKSFSKKATTSQQNTFSEVKIMPNRSKVLRIIHPNGIECLIPTSLNEADILSIIRGLKSCWFQKI